MISIKGICGLWAGDDEQVHLSLEDGEGGRKEVAQAFMPYTWIEAVIIVPEGINEQKLSGDGSLNRLVRFPTREAYERFLRLHGKLGDNMTIASLENQYLLEHEQRLFDGMHLGEVRRCQLDIETRCSIEGSFSNAKRSHDRILAIGLKMGGVSKYLILEEDSHAAERAVLEGLNAVLHQWDPDIIEGHNIFNFDFDYLRIRCAKLGVPCAWGRFGQNAIFRKSRLKVAESFVDFSRCEIPGRAVFDTYLMVQLYDVAKRELESYSLKSVAVALGFTDPVNGNRTYLDGNKIHDVFFRDREQFLAYLEDDLCETKFLADLLLPTYFAQVQSFPMTLQEAALKGTAGKIDLIFLEKYFHAKESLPAPDEVKTFSGGFTKIYELGIFKHVLHFDVASLYPSLLMVLGKSPKSDSLKCFIPLLKEFREYRLEYKKKAREADDQELKREYEARQMAFKVLINSFYGYLGFNGARFADGDLAAEVTASGRDLLQVLIKKFQELGCVVLEADTDGIYISSEKYFAKPEELLKMVSVVMPQGVDLEYDGAYQTMFSYKAKNYALREGNKIIIRGSALRSRGMEPFLKELTNCLLYYLLGASNKNPKVLLDNIRASIENEEIEVSRLAKSERLNQRPEMYVNAVKNAKTPRRAALEVALKKHPISKMGDKVTYFIAKGTKTRMPDWHQAQPIEYYDEDQLPYDKTYYLRKLDDWVRRYADFMPEVVD